MCGLGWGARLRTSTGRPCLRSSAGSSASVYQRYPSVSLNALLSQYASPAPPSPPVPSTPVCQGRATRNDARADILTPARSHRPVAMAARVRYLRRGRGRVRWLAAPVCAASSCPCRPHSGPCSTFASCWCTRRIRPCTQRPQGKAGRLCCGDEVSRALALGLGIPS
jgi:hypothetical protein